MLLVAGGAAVRILIPVPLKAIVLVWGLLSGMILVGFVTSSLIQGKDPFAPRKAVTVQAKAKAGAAHSGQHSDKYARTLHQ